MDALEIKARLQGDGLASDELRKIIERLDALEAEPGADRQALRPLRDTALRRLQDAVLAEAPAKLETALEKLPAALDDLERLNSERDESEVRVVDLLAEISHQRKLVEDGQGITARDSERVAQHIRNRSQIWREQVCAALG